MTRRPDLGDGCAKHSNSFDIFRTETAEVAWSERKSDDTKNELEHDTEDVTGIVCVTGNVVAGNIADALGHFMLRLCCCTSSENPLGLQGGIF